MVLLALLHCGSPTFALDQTSADLTPVRAEKKATNVGGPSVVVGRYCPDRDVVEPLFVRLDEWSANPNELAATVSHNRVRQFSIFNGSGRRVGLFSVVGASQYNGAIAAAGGYAGAKPCAVVNGNNYGAEDPHCVAVTRGCGIAVGAVTPSSGLHASPWLESPEPFSIQVRGVCVQGDDIALDLDGDQRLEAIARKQWWVSAALADEVSIGAGPRPRCVPRFFHPDLVTEPAVLDAIAVGDFDDDSRTELLLSDRATSTWHLLTARTGGRLERVMP